MLRYFSFFDIHIIAATLITNYCHYAIVDAILFFTSSPASQRYADMLPPLPPIHYFFAAMLPLPLYERHCLPRRLRRHTIFR